MILSFIKNFWMLLWRALLFGIIFIHNSTNVGIALFVAFFGALALLIAGKSIHMWPLFGLIFKRRNPLYSRAERKRASKERMADAPAPYNGVIQTATANGVITGLEPQQLAAVSIFTNPWMYGNPGSGLHSSGFSSTAVNLGVLGETNFAKAMSMTYGSDGKPLIASYPSYWSVAMPSESSPLFKDAKYSTDIDAVVLAGDTLYLIDLKNYSGGDVIYRSNESHLFTYDRQTNSLVGQPKKMSRNMAMATDRFQRHFPKLKIQPVVVLMPTDKGEGVVDNVYWPGDIPAVNLRDMLTTLSSVRNRNISSAGAEAMKAIPHLVQF